MSAGVLIASLVAVATATAADDTIIIISDDPAPTESTDDVLIIEDEGDPFEDSASVFSIRARASASLSLQLGVDTSFDRPDEQVGELMVAAGLVVDVDLSDEVRVYAAPRLKWVGAIDREGDDREILYALVPEAYLSWARGPVQVRAGYLIFDWGTSELIGPNDVLNPLDLRQSLSALDSATKIPTPGAEVVGTFGPLTVRGVVLPTFTAGRFHITGWDVAAVQGSSALSSPQLNNPAVLNPAYIDRVGDELLQTDRPRDRLDSATLALRASATLDTFDVAFNVVHGWNPLPSITVDPNLLVIGEEVAQARIEARPPAFDTPELAAALIGLQNAVEANAPLFKGKFERRTVLGIDAAWALDPFILKFDAAYSTRQVFYTSQGQARPTPMITGVVGLEYYFGETLQIWVEAFVQHLVDVPGPGSLLYLEAAAMDLEPGRSVTNYGVGAFGRWQVYEGRLAFELGTLVSSRGDFALLPRVAYTLDELQQLSLGGLLVEGRADGAGGTYSHLDQLYLGYRLTY